MATRGFCPHGKVWTTCPICGKDVIAAQASRKGADIEDFGIPTKKPKKPVRRAGDEEVAEAPVPEEEAGGTEAES